MAELEVFLSTSERPPHLAHGSWLGDFSPKLTTFEMRLVSCCAEGVVCQPEGWDGERPTEATFSNEIRGELLRFLALGGDILNPCHQNGVMIRGVWVSGSFIAQQSRFLVRFTAISCNFEQAPLLNGAEIPDLVFRDCKLPGLLADRVKVSGGIFLDRGFESTCEVRLLGAKIGSDLTCINGKFSTIHGKAIVCTGSAIGGSVHFQDIEVNGETCLMAAKIGGSLDCTNGIFSNQDKMSFDLQQVTVSGALLLRNTRFDGRFDLADANVGTLIDDPSCWISGGHIFDGFQYNQIIGMTQAVSGIEWLNRQHTDHLGKEFKPQPWEQLIKVLRNMGHPYDAAAVAIAKQESLRKAGQIRGITRNLMHWLYGVLAGYGHRPIRTVGWMAVVWLALVPLYDNAAQRGAMAPANPVLHSHEGKLNVDVSSCGVAGDVKLSNYWTRCSAMPPEYTTFNALFYSLDLILPLVDLQQDSDWAPVVTDSKGNWLWPGWWARTFMWFEILFGWMPSLTLVAVLGRLVEKD